MESATTRRHWRCTSTDSTIADVLNLTVNEALAFSKSSPIHDKLKTLSDVGLGYIRLGQPANTLSGGEAQRIKLSGRTLAPLSRKNPLHFGRADNRTAL